MLEFEIPWNYSNKVNETTQYYYDSGDYEKLREFVKININQIKINNDTDINNVWLLFKKSLTEGVEKFVPKKCINYNNINRDKWKYKLPDRIKTIN